MKNPSSTTRTITKVNILDHRNKYSIGDLGKYTRKPNNHKNINRPTRTFDTIESNQTRLGDDLDRPSPADNWISKTAKNRRKASAKPRRNLAHPRQLSKSPRRIDLERVPPVTETMAVDNGRENSRYVPTIVDPWIRGSTDRGPAGGRGQSIVKLLKN